MSFSSFCKWFKTVFKEHTVSISRAALTKQKKKTLLQLSWMRPSDLYRIKVNSKSTSFVGPPWAGDRPKTRHLHSKTGTGTYI